MLVNRTGTRRTGAAEHKRRAVTVAVQIQRAVTFVAAHAAAAPFALLLHHHATPFGACVLEPYLCTNGWGARLEMLLSWPLLSCLHFTVVYIYL